MLKFTDDTSTLPLDELMHLWRRGDLTETQMVGHLLQHITHIDKRVLRLEQPSTQPQQSLSASEPMEFRGHLPLGPTPRPGRKRSKK